MRWPMFLIELAAAISWRLDSDAPAAISFQLTHAPASSRFMRNLAPRRIVARRSVASSHISTQLLQPRVSDWFSHFCTMERVASRSVACSSHIVYHVVQPLASPICISRFMARFIAASVVSPLFVASYASSQPPNPSASRRFIILLPACFSLRSASRRSSTISHQPTHALASSRFIMKLAACRIAPSASLDSRH